ncbi:hypothetical protein [Methyloligella solikamskensis]|uniref:Uncharacterized protein n=1 Tax=Methyloligella solikamskensis TaxID=1177756 RepID=A0ABW3JBE7_9HYPH
MTIEIVAPMGCAGAAALGPQSAGELGDDMLSSLDGGIGDLMRPERDEARQVAFPRIGLGSGPGHPAIDVAVAPGVIPLPLSSLTSIAAHLNLIVRPA